MAHQQQPNEHQQLFRLNLLFALIIVCALLLILRLGYMQISEYTRYKTLSLKNQMNVIPISPPRGVIVDRNGVMLAENVPVYFLEIVPERVANLKETIAKLQILLPSINEDDLENFYKAKQQNRSFIPIPIKMKLSPEEVATFAINQYRFPGVSIKARSIRHYPMGEVAAHVVGYVGRINLEELKTVNATNYRATNFIGKSGIERYYEDFLHGEVGYQTVETDVSGRMVRVMNKQAPHSGAKLYLTIDARLQQAAYDALKGKRGAVVLMSAHQGEVLAMASAPSFDPNLFVSGVSKKDYKTLSNAQERPLYNRAVRGTYPPASTVKPFLALAGVDKGYVTPQYGVYDPGFYKLPNSSHAYRDWRKGGHGIVNLKRAITVSCDIYFYQLGNKMGISVIEDFMTQFGYGHLSHIDLFEEASGVVPSIHWKRQTKGQPWYPGDTIITSIGQGFMLATPLQIANATASLSQHGRRYRPHLLSKLINSDNNQTYVMKPFEEYPVKLKNDMNWGLISEAMRNVIVNNEGTGYKFGRTAPYSVAAKTGTAQVFSGHQYDKTRYDDIPYALRDNSLFIAFAPVEDPEVAIAVIVEHEATASIVARQVMDKYFELYHPEIHS